MNFEKRSCSYMDEKKVFIDNIVKKVTVNFELTKNSCNYTGGLCGNVTNHLGKPVKNALVKIMTVNYDIAFQTRTDYEGNYYFCNIPINICYKIAAIAPEYKVSEEMKFCIRRNTVLKINLILHEELDDCIGIIVGNVCDILDAVPINKALVVLYEEVKGCEILKMLVYTNDSGQFAFTKLPLGNYIVRICAMGYLAESTRVNITKCEQIVDITVNLYPDNSQLNGTVSGVITDQSNKPINEADVILYKVIDNNQSIPIDFTRTNEDGMYLFINVDLGFYKITAK